MNKKFDSFLVKISHGSVKYENPSNLNFDTLDNKIKKCIKLINQSNWCRTLWSCQGHKNKNRDGCMLPYVTFILKKEKLTYLLNLIYKTLPVNSDKKFPVHSSNYIELNKGFCDKNFIIISVHWSKNYVTEKKLRKSFFESLNKISKEIKHAR